MGTYNAVDVCPAGKEPVQAGLRSDVEVLEVVAFRVDQVNQRDRPVTREVEIDELVIPSTLRIWGRRRGVWRLLPRVRGLCSRAWGAGAEQTNAWPHGRIAIQRPVHRGDAPGAHHVNGRLIWPYFAEQTPFHRHAQPAYRTQLRHVDGCGQVSVANNPHPRRAAQGARTAQVNTGKHVVDPCADVAPAPPVRNELPGPVCLEHTTASDTKNNRILWRQDFFIHGDFHVLAG